MGFFKKYFSCPLEDELYKNFWKVKSRLVAILMRECKWIFFKSLSKWNGGEV